MAVGRAGCVGAAGCFAAAVPDGGISQAGKARGRRGAGPVAAFVQVAHTKRTTSLVWRHMIKIFSPLPLPEAIYCFSTASPLGQRARRCSRPRDAPARTAGTGECGHRGRVQPWPLAARLPWGDGRSLALPSHLRSSTVWSVSSVLTDTYFTFKNFASEEILHLFVLLCYVLVYNICVFSFKSRSYHTSLVIAPPLPAWHRAGFPANKL